jgi:hypothetical protein
MSKIIMALAAVAGLGAAGALGATAGSSDTATPMGCVASTPDAGVVANEECAISWACSSDEQYFQIICTGKPGNLYSCVCTSNQNTDTQTIVVPAFLCQDMTSRPVAGGCGWAITD